MIFAEKRNSELHNNEYAPTEDLRGFTISNLSEGRPRRMAGWRQGYRVVGIEHPSARPEVWTDILTDTEFRYHHPRTRSSRADFRRGG